jgi:putative membrane-bound dehydrogenase-like protein
MIRPVAEKDARGQFFFHRGNVPTALDILQRFFTLPAMRPVIPLLILHSSCFILPAQDTSLVRESQPLSPQEQLRTFKLPPGFSAQLIASEPVINKPMNLAFDDKGRLWCTSSAEYPWAIKPDKWKSPEGLLDSSKDKILVFSDSDGDGVVDKPAVFADNLNIPIGVLPYKNGCIAWSIPNIWRLEDTDGDGKCDKRTVLFGPLGWEMDTHGMISSLIMGPDGWIYATHGFNNTSHFKVLPQNNPAAANRPKKPTPSAQNTGVPRSELDWGFSLDLHSGNVFRFKPDGSAVEPYCWGQVNPFGMCQDSYGSFYTADCHSNPITALIPGAFYQSFGKPHDGMGFAPVMCEHAHGSTGLCGVVYIDGDIWGPEWNDHMFVGNCVTSRINHDKITFTGATPKANEQPDFMTTDDGWFRPVNLQLGPDGALYVADFYNKIIGHYEVPLTHPGRDRERGRIWRIVKEGAKKTRTLNEEQSNAQHLRFQIKTGKTNKFIHYGPNQPRLRQAAAESFIISDGNVGGFGLSYILNIQPNDATLRHTGLLAVRRGLELPGGFEEISKDRSLKDFETDIAAIIRTIQSTEASAWTLNYLLTQPQTNRDELRSTITSLAKTLPGDGEAKLIGFVKQHFASDHDAQVELAASIRQGIARRGGKPGPEATAWLTEVAGRLFAELAATPAATEWDPPPGDGWVLQQRTCDDGKVITVLSSLGNKGEEFASRTKSSVFTCPPKFSFYVCGHRGAPNKPAHEFTYVRLLDAANVELIRAYPPRNDVAHRVEWDLSAHAGKPVRFEIADRDDNETKDAYAWLAAGRFDPPVISIPTLRGEGGLRNAAQMAGELGLTAQVPLLSQWLARPGVSAETRSTIASSLAAMNQPQAIAAVLKTAPSSVQNVLAEVLAGTADGAAALMECGVPVLLTQPVVAQKIAALGRKDLKDKRDALTKDLPPASAEADALIKTRIQQHAAAKKDAAAGLVVFKTHCAICHKIGNEGNVVGPQLEGAGQRGIERLCEDILDPHRAVDPMFRMHLVTQKDGTVHAGLIRRDDAGSLVLVNATGQEVTVAKDTIAKDELAPVSLMPATFGLSIPEADFHNLLAWLAAQK